MLSFKMISTKCKRSCTHKTHRVNVDGWMNRRKLERLSRPAKAGATKMWKIYQVYLVPFRSLLFDLVFTSTCTGLEAFLLCGGMELGARGCSSGSS